MQAANLRVVEPIAPSLPPAVAAVQARYAGAFGFWTAGMGAGTPAPALQDLCDALYVLALSAGLSTLTPDAPERFAEVVKAQRLAGDLTPAVAPKPLSVHATAYALGVMTVLAPISPQAHRRALKAEGWRLDALVEAESLTPRWPKAWSHHSWRASHWVGGAPSILLSLSRLAPDTYAAHGAPLIEAVLEAADALIDPKTGFLRLYKSAAAHALFNALYRLRHDPLAGEVGGVVHLHWVNHAVGRPYRAGAALAEAAARLLLAAPRFMEATPYCLDFDVVQILRTARPDAAADSEIRARLERLEQDLASFIGTEPDAAYTLHRLPGALATMHETALALGRGAVRGLGVGPTDIIARAHWL